MRTFVPNTTAGPRLLAALAPDVTVLDVQVESELVLLRVTPSSTTASCPRCSTQSARIHSYYIRQPHDLPISGRATRLMVHARRFRCINPACSTVTFAERLPNLVALAAQRTVRLNAALRDLALAFGGEAGARQSARSAMPVSGDTLLRRAHINLRAETAGFSRAEEARGGAGSLSTLDLRAAVSGFLLLKTPNCGTLVLVGDCPDRAEGTIRALHPWTRFERVTN